MGGGDGGEGGSGNWVLNTLEICFGKVWVEAFLLVLVGRFRELGLVFWDFLVGGISVNWIGG